MNNTSEPAILAIVPVASSELLPIVENAQLDLLIKHPPDHAFQFVESMKSSTHPLKNVNASPVIASFKENATFVKSTSLMKLQSKAVFQFAEQMKFIHSNLKNVYVDKTST